MRIYQLTEAQKNALLNELRLEKFNTPDQFCLTDEAREVQRAAVESMHRRFHYHVTRALESDS